MKYVVSLMMQPSRQYRSRNKNDLTLQHSQVYEHDVMHMNQRRPSTTLSGRYKYFKFLPPVCSTKTTIWRVPIIQYRIAHVSFVDTLLVIGSLAVLIMSIRIFYSARQMLGELRMDGVDWQTRS
jgi:hypothetical protein